MIYSGWEDIPETPFNLHDGIFLQILNKHGFHQARLPVPLQARYTKGRRWSSGELRETINAWHDQKSITFVAACLNRNPQDMIYKLLDYCKSNGIDFTQKYRSESTLNWSDSVKGCAQELFENGLPAWKIAAIFRVDFERIEKELFVKRDQYGHKKKNPFGINTDHKQLLNREILKLTDVRIERVFEPFAGEGRFTQTVLKHDTVTEVYCVEQDAVTFEVLKSNVADKRVRLLRADNLPVIRALDHEKFDLIDLDPFVTCHEQLDLIWPHLNAEALLFLTFGGEYRRSFIKTNRQSIAARYGFFDDPIDNTSYLELVPAFFLGHAAWLAAQAGFVFEVIRAVRYANNCRFWLKTNKVDADVAARWLAMTIRPERGGYFFKDLKMPRFREVRAEIDQERQGVANHG